MTTPGSVYLASSSHGKTFGAMVERALAAVRARDANRKPKVAISYAAVADSLGGRAFMKGYATKTFWGAELDTFHVAGEKSKMDPANAKAIVDEADLIFLSGGDPVLGAKLLRDAGADAWLRDARARGAALLGMSAGAMMLCAWWASWPDEAPDGAPWDGGSLVKCTGVVPDLVVDCHAEEDDWAELKAVSEMLAARDVRPPPRRLGLATGHGIIVAHDGTFEAVGGAPYDLPPY